MCTFTDLSTLDARPFVLPYKRVIFSQIFFISKAISQITELEPGMFVLI